MIPTKEPLAIVVMGVSGSGKSSIGKAVASASHYEFVDADDLHPVSNVEKMRGGTPLTDEDRWPWLAAVARAMEERLAAGEGVVVACSALKRIY
ncbi:MAG TPA: gluconokinase, partial [Trueperaceae bacterium]|nr:gluconokinase [Trueperaceae bacterium]